MEDFGRQLYLYLVVSHMVNYLLVLEKKVLAFGLEESRYRS